MDIAISSRTQARTCSLPRSAPPETDSFGDEHIGKVRVKELPDTTEGKGEPQRLDENRQLVIRVPESYSHPSHDAGIISMHGDIGPIESLQPQYQRDVGNMAELRAQITLEVEQGSALSRNETFNNGNPAKLTLIRTDTEESKRSSISTFITAKSFRSSVETFRTANTGLHSITRESTVSRSSWYELLRSENLIPEPLNEKDWSGRGEHAEFKPNEWSKILDILPVEGLLGTSATAVVESVRCRRILLARKTIRCTRRMKRADALKEVQHLKKLEHSHVVQVVGTYTFKEDFAILLYPAAEHNLETFMDSIIAESSGRGDFRNQERTKLMLHAMSNFFGCLAHTIEFLHRNATKHMDIKPKNLLIKDMRHKSSQKTYKIYIADFGITRSYERAADAETDSPTSFTRMYAAPEVVDQRKRGLRADIFSLGCVFAEMLAVLSQWDRESKRADLFAIISSDQNSPRSYQANHLPVAQWLREIGKLNTDNSLCPELFLLPCRVIGMLDPDPTRRPSAEMVASWFGISTSCCATATGPDPFSIDRLIEEGNEDNDSCDAESDFSLSEEQVNSLFQVCVDMRKRLSRVPGFHVWMQGYVPDPCDDEDLDALTTLWAIFRRGFPLIALYNLLSPAVPAVVSEKVPERERERNATSIFLRAYMMNFRISISECFTLIHMYSSNMLGFVKVIKVVSHMLDILDEKGILSSGPLNDCGYVVDSNATITISSHSSSRDVLVPHGSASPILIKHIVENFVDDERRYTRYLKNLRCFLVDIGLPYDVHMICSNLEKILVLQSQLLVHFERIYAKPEALQNWGKPFNLFQSCFEVYVPFAVGLRSSVELAKHNFRTFGVTDGGPELRTLTERRSNVELLLLKPFKQLAKYRSFLQEIHVSSKLEPKKKSISTAIDVISGVIERVALACQQIKDHTASPEDLNSQDHKNLGDILFHGTFEISERQGRTDPKCEIYLFEHVLLGYGSIFMRDVTGSTLLEKPGSYKLQILFEGASSFGDLTIHFTTLEMAKRFTAQIDRISSIYAAPSWPIGWSMSMLRACKDSLPQPANLTVIFHAEPIIRIRLMRLNFNYAILKNYLDTETRGSGTYGCFLKYFGSGYGPIFIYSDEGLQHVLGDWLEKLANDKKPHDLELWYDVST